MNEDIAKLTDPTAPETVEQLRIWIYRILVVNVVQGGVFRRQLPNLTPNNEQFWTDLADFIKSKFCMKFTESGWPLDEEIHNVITQWRNSADGQEFLTKETQATPETPTK